MAKKESNAEEVSNDVLLQINSDQEQTADESSTQKQKDDIDITAVDDIMKRYDETEKKEKQNEEFVKVLKKDDKLKNFFLQNYVPGTDPADDEKFIAFSFSQFSEQGWSEDGKPLDKQVLSKKKGRKFAEAIVNKWKGFA